MTVTKDIQTELIQACIKGDSKAQFQLFEAYKVQMYGICLRYTKSKIEAEDVLQEGFFKVFKDIGNFKNEGALGAWIRKIMVNTALMHLRKNKKWANTKVELDGIPEGAISHDELRQKDRANAIIYLIQKLPVIQQTIFNLRVIDGFPFSDISETTGIKEATVRSHYLRARKSLQTLLNQSLLA